MLCHFSTPTLANLATAPSRSGANTTSAPQTPQCFLHVSQRVALEHFQQVLESAELLSPEVLSDIYNCVEQRADVAEVASNDEGLKVLELLARRAQTPKGILHTLATLPQESLRVAIAKNHMLDSGLLEQLLKNETNAIKSALRANPAFQRTPLYNAI